MIDPFTDEQFGDFDPTTATHGPGAPSSAGAPYDGRDGPDSVQAAADAAAAAAVTVDWPAVSLYAPVTPASLRASANVLDHEPLPAPAVPVGIMPAVSPSAGPAPPLSVSMDTVSDSMSVSSAASRRAGDKPLGIFCTLCREEVSSRSELLGHVASVHPNVLDVKEIELASVQAKKTTSIGVHVPSSRVPKREHTSN